jgi:hypothetical protein
VSRKAWEFIESGLNRSIALESGVMLELNRN